MSAWYVKRLAETERGLEVTFRRDGPADLDIYMPEEITGVFHNWVKTERSLPARAADT